MQPLLEYFPNLSATQLEQFAQLEPLYREWNERINVISRKDIENLYTRHLLHSLALPKIMTISPGSRVLDLGTGGGFPGIPLAIFFPQVQFVLVDGTGKKIKVVQAVAEALGLDNVDARHIRVEYIKKERFDLVVTRAVAETSQLLQWSRRLISDKQRNAYPNGLWAWKGRSSLDAEVKTLHPSEYFERFPIHQFFSDPFFEEKELIFVQV